MSTSRLPPEFVCSITQDIMISPVIAADGHIYEKDAIIEWIRRAGTSPLTRAPLRVVDLRENDGLRNQIVCWRNNLIKRRETPEGTLQLENEFERNNPSYGMGHIVVEMSLPQPPAVVVPATPSAPVTPSAHSELTEQDFNCLARFFTRMYYIWCIITVTIVVIITYLGVWGKFG